MKIWRCGFLFLSILATSGLMYLVLSYLLNKFILWLSLQQQHTVVRHLDKHVLLMQQ